jgi:hypothetical protein
MVDVVARDHPYVQVSRRHFGRRHARGPSTGGEAENQQERNSSHDPQEGYTNPHREFCKGTLVVSGSRGTEAGRMIASLPLS